MPAKNGFQRITIDIPKEEHIKLKLISTILGKSMHTIIVESINNRLKDFKGMENIEKLKEQNRNS